MHSSRPSRIAPYPMMDMLGLGGRENNNDRHKLYSQSVVSDDNPPRENPPKRPSNSRQAQFSGSGFVV
jgi:hypothetical protein